MNSYTRILKVILVFIFISLLVGCRVSDSPDTTQSELDYWPTTEWRSSTPEEQGMDSEMLAEMVEYIMKQNYDIHSVTVIRNGYMVADVNFYPYEANTLHQLWSSTKSITGTLIGIAIDQGHIDSVNQSILSFFPERSIDNLDQNKETMTLEHLLMMGSGLDCRDDQHGWSGMAQTYDWVQYLLDLPMRGAPGTHFFYCNGDSFLLSAIIQEITGMTALDYAEEYLFGPLGINDVVWPTNPQGINLGMSDLRMKPHDMAKIGYLYLNEGRWDDEQILSPDWVEAASTPQITNTYGYQWWIVSNGIYSAEGYGGQFITVIPEYEMVVVITGNMHPGGIAIRNILLDYIIAAVQSSKSLPPNPESVELLNSNIQQALQYRVEPKFVPPLPEIAKRVSGQTYILDNNPLAIESVTLTFPGGTEALLEIKRIFMSDTELPMGLDNAYRFSPGRYGIPMGVKGEWVSDETIAIDIDLIGDAQRIRYWLTFNGEYITLRISSDDGLTYIEGSLEN